MSVIFNDMFTGAVDTDLASHTPDTGTSWTKTSGAGGIALDGNGNAVANGESRYEAAPAAVQLAMEVVAGIATNPTAIVISLHRTPVGGADGYEYTLVLAGGTYGLFKFVNTSATQLATGTAATAPYTASLGYNGATVYYKEDGVAAASISDSAIDTPAPAALYSNSIGDTISEFTYQTIAAVAPAPTLTNAEIQADGTSALLTFSVSTPPIAAGTNGSGLTFSFDGLTVSPTTITAPATNQLQAWIPARPASNSAVLLDYSTNSGSIIDDAANLLSDISSYSCTNSSTFSYPTTPQRQAMSRQARR